MPSSAWRAPERTALSFLLASGSPQRRAIFTQLGLRFRVEVPDVEELGDGDPEYVAVENSRRKAAAAVGSAQPGELVVAVDTIVVLDGQVYGKPAGKAEARSMLELLREREHTVIGGLTLLRPGSEPASHTFAVHTAVRFRSFDDALLERYLAGGEWDGRAGGYAIQGTGAAFVAAITGDYYNVVGFPVAAFLDLLDTEGIRP
jgi:septum formation protein